VSENEKTPAGSPAEGGAAVPAGPQKHGGASVETDHRIEVFLGQLLRAGVVLAALVVIVGGVMYLRQAATGPVPDYKVFHSQPVEMRSAPLAIEASAEFDPLAIIQVGLLLLIATPVARVVFSIVGFSMERDWMYVGFTIVVLTLLIFSIAGDPQKLFNR
jgi:uncharacterized membrane protein